MADWADLGPVQYFLGCDLGQSADYTALSLVEKRGDDRLTCHLSVRHLKRFPLQTPYSDIVLALSRMVDDAPLDTKIILDRTGVGAGVFDFFQAHELMRKRRGAVLGVNIHGGDAETHEGPLWRVPKRNLVAAVAVPLQTRRLKIPASLPEVPQLIKELEAFKVKIDPVTAHDSYSSWRESTHDDIVLALALGCWAALHPVLNAKWGTSPHPRLG